MRAVRLLAALALLNGLGAADVFLQGYAWARMTLRGLGAASLAVSFEDALSGRHPCSLCLSLRRAARGPSVASAVSSPRVDFVLPSESAAADGIALSVFPDIAFAWPFSGRAVIPPTPPPDRLPASAS